MLQHYFAGYSNWFIALQFLKDRFYNDLLIERIYFLNGYYLKTCRMLASVQAMEKLCAWEQEIKTRQYREGTTRMRTLQLTQEGHSVRSAWTHVQYPPNSSRNPHNHTMKLLYLKFSFLSTRKETPGLHGEGWSLNWQAKSAWIQRHVSLISTPVRGLGFKGHYTLWNSVIPSRQSITIQMVQGTS